jgi:hypothetical protein
MGHTLLDRFGLLRPDLGSAGFRGDDASASRPRGCGGEEAGCDRERERLVQAVLEGCRDEVREEAAPADPGGLVWR